MILKTVKNVLMDNTFSTRRPSKTVVKTVSLVVQELTLLLVQLPVPFAPKGRICHLRVHKNPSKNVKFVQREPMRTHLKTKKHAKNALPVLISSREVQIEPFMTAETTALNAAVEQLVPIQNKRLHVFVNHVNRDNLLLLAVKPHARTAQ